MGSRRLAASAAAFAVVVGLLGSQSQAVATGTPEPSAKEVLLEGNPDLAKVSMHLLDARRLARTDTPSGEIAARVPVLRFVDGLPLIEIRFSKLTPATVARVEDIGFRPTGTFPDLGAMVGIVDYELLDEIAALPAVAVIRPEYGAQVATGSVTSQADVSIRAAAARTQFGVDGTGVTVGVLSDSFNDTLSGGTVTGTGCSRAVTGLPNQTSGDLPPSVKVLDNGPGLNTDEGAGMAELIADLAPGADLMFHTAFNNLPDFASGITELHNCGADVIVDDIIYFAEPMFQDGLIAQAAQDAVDAGVPYYASANNQGRFGVDSDYDDWNPAVDDSSRPPSGDDFHDFGSGDRFAAVTIPNGAGARFVLQWNEPFASLGASGAGLGSGAVNDLDLYLCSAENPASCTVASSTDVQGCSVGDPAAPSGDPMEMIAYTNTTGAAQTVYLAVEHYCGSENVHFRIGAFGINISVTGLTYEPSIYNEFQLYGHAAASGVGAVAAVDYREIDSGGSTTGGPEVNVESFSNLGGDLPFYFDRNGDPLPGAPVTRYKPDIAAPDGTNTTFFGGTDTEPDGFPNFYGTSAAAPHAAAIAALMLDLDPALTPAQILGALASTAIDIEAAGTDPLAGAGLIDAVDALTAAGAATPGNDDVADAVTVAIPSTTVSSNANATTEVGETTVCPDPVNGDSTYGSTVWYRVQPGSDASLVVDTRGSGFDTVMGVYSGTLGSLTQVGCNDDIDFGVDLDAEVSFPATAGTTYWIQIGGWGNPAEEGQFTLNIAVLPPGNDDVADVVTVAIPSTTVSSNANATTEVGETTVCPDPVNGDSTYGSTVWYRVQPGSDASLVVDTRGSGFDTVMGVYSGTLGSLTQVGCNDDIDFGVDLDAEVSFPATAGTTYWIQIGGWGNPAEEGQFTLNIAAVGGSFTDDDGNVHEGFIEAMAISGITLGCNPPDNDMYCPRDAVSRAQMATFLVRALGLTPSDDNGDFTDHLASVHRRNINALRIAGITQGCNPPDNTLYCPNDSVTREQMATFLVRALGLTPSDDNGDFTDHLASVHRRNINALRIAGITQGCNPPDNTLYCPKDPVRRDQMATFIGRALGLTSMVPPAAYDIGDGVWGVGSDVQPGTYRNSDSTAGCYWARLSGFGGGTGDVIADEFTYQRDVVTIDAGDAGFESDTCGTWSNRILPRTSSITAPFGGGAFFVGSEVAPGTWRNSDSTAGCYWERLTGFSGALADIVTNQFSSAIQTVTIDAADYGFFSENCGTWTKIG